MLINIPSGYDSRHNSLGTDTSILRSEVFSYTAIPRPVPGFKKCLLSFKYFWSVHLSLPGVSDGQGLHFWDYSISYISAR